MLQAGLLTRHDGEAVALQAPPSDELPERVQCALETGNGLTVESLAQRVAAAPERALAAVRELVGRKQLHHWGEGEQERFFARDPLATLSERVPELLGSEAVGLVELRRRVEQHLPGHGLVLAEWLKHALRGGALFEGAPKGGGRVKTYACRPNLRRSLRRTLAALEGELPALRGAGLSRGEVAAFLADQLGALPDGGAPAPEVADPRTARGEGASGESNGARVALLKALHELEDESPRGALLSVRELRGRCGLEKPTFDRAALELAVQGRVSLHAHDHAAALLEAERRSLIEDARGVHYVGIASVGDACQEVGIL